MKNPVLIHEVHDMWPATLHEVGRMSKSNPFYIIMQIGEDSAYKNSDYVVSLPPLAEKYMIKHGLKQGAFVHIPNGIVEEEWNDPEDIPAEHKKVLERLKDNFIVGYFGGHAISNALDLLIEAAEKNKDDDVIFVFVGDGVEKKKLQSRVKDHDLKNVVFLPKVSKKAIPTLVSYFDCSYIGSRNSTLYRFGLCLNKIFDSMRAGKPIICAISTPDDLITRHKCGIMVGSNDPDAINKAIRELKDKSVDERRQMGLNAIKAVGEHYTYKRSAERFAALF